MLLMKFFYCFQIIDADAYLQVKEFLDHADEGVVVVSDSPTVQQIKDWPRNTYHV